MKANELMIGDWVNWHTYTNRPHYCQIKQISFDTRIEGSEILNCDPIPITEDILKVNGFDKNIDSKIAFTMDTYVGDCHIWLQFINDSIFLGLTKHGAGSFDLHKYVKSVHELQHALRLCGLTALADSFKIG